MRLRGELIQLSFCDVVYVVDVSEVVGSDKGLFVHVVPTILFPVYVVSLMIGDCGCGLWCYEGGYHGEFDALPCFLIIGSDGVPFSSPGVDDDSPSTADAGYIDVPTLQKTSLKRGW